MKFTRIIQKKAPFHKIIDSGASHNFISDMKYLRNIKRIKNIKVKVASSDETLRATHKGYIDIKHKNVTLSLPTFYVQGCEGLYVSQPHLDKNGYTSIISNSTYIVKDSRSRTMLKATLTDLYHISNKYNLVIHNEFQDSKSNHTISFSKTSSATHTRKRRHDALCDQDISLSDDGTNYNTTSGPCRNTSGKSQISSATNATAFLKSAVPTTYSFKKNLTEDPSTISDPILRSTDLVNKKVNNSVDYCDNVNSVNMQSHTNKNRIVNYDLMHARYAHPSHQRLINSINNTDGCKLRSNKRKGIKICTTCDLSKTTRARINKNMKGITRDSNAYRVNTDVKKYPRSIRGYRYILVFIHEGSRYLTTYLMKRKSESLKYLKQYKAFANAAIGGRFLELRGDNAGEYTGQRFQDYLKDQGINWKPSTPRTPEQNGISERTIRTLCTMIRSMLNHADMSYKYWCYACETATYLYNRLEHSALKGVTPYEKFIGKRPNISNLITFGCIGVSHVPQDRRDNALSDTARYVRMIGYHKRFNTYIVMTKNGKVLSRKISKWHEKVFKFPKRKRREITISSDDDAEEYPTSPTDTKSSSPKNHTPQDSIAASRPRRKRVFPERMGQDLIFNEIKTSLNEQDDVLNNTNIKEAYLSSMKSIDDTTPKTYKQATTGNEQNHWIPSIKDELNSLRETGTFELAKLPKGVNIVSSKWVFKKKINPDDSIRFKSRLVARGYTQQFNSDYFYTYFPTLSLCSFRLLLAYAAKHGYDLSGIDIKTAYLYGLIDADIYMQIPHGFSPTPSEKKILDLPGKTVWKLRKSIYGLKQSAYLWGKTFSKFLTGIGFKKLTADPCLYVHTTRNLIIATYVDDVIILHKNRQDHTWLLKELQKPFKINDLGPLKQCLNIEIIRTKGSILISQRKYIERIFNNFKIHKYPKATTPRSTTANLDLEESADYDPKYFRSQIGALIYLTIGTRADISEAVSTLASYSQSPKKIHKKAVHRIIQYLYNTRHYKIEYKRGTNIEDLHAFSDANLSSGKKHGFSRTGLITFYAGGPISWKSKLQTIVCESTRDSEYIAASTCSRDLIYAREFLQDLTSSITGKNVKLPPSTLYCDNKPAINTIVRSGYTEKSKSIRLAYHKIRDLYQRGEIVPEHIDTNRNIADLLTKPLPASKTAEHCSIIFNTSAYNNHKPL